MENLEKAISELKSAFPGMDIREHESMAERCSFKCGGSVRAFAAPGDIMSLTKLCCILKENRQAPYMLGNCTNLVFPDTELDIMAVSCEKLTGLRLLPDGAIYAEAGVSLARLASFAQQNELAGLEFASGIPGSVGGGLLMNAGAYGGELKDCVESVVIYYLPEQRLYELSGEQCDFAYRSSIFKKIPGCVILSGVFRLEKGDGEEISAKMRDYNGRRRDKQPLDMPSAGSSFKRPEGHFAAALIEQAGLRGYRLGGAQVSEKHAGFIVNAGGATAKDIHDLAAHVRKTVYEKFSVVLEPEMIMLPPDLDMSDNSPQVPRHMVFPVNENKGERKGNN